MPVTEANLTLSFDHRVLDGGAAGRLLARIGGAAGGAGETLTGVASSSTFGS